MPIVYISEDKIFKVIDPTPEEEKALMDLGMQYLTAKIGAQAAQHAFARTFTQMGPEDETEKEEEAAPAIEEKKVVH